MSIKIAKLEIYRGFTGTEEFLSTAAILGRKIFGTLESAKIVPLPPTGQIDEDSGLNYRETIQLNKRIAKVYTENDLKLVLLDRRMPIELNPNFHRVASKLFAKNTRVYRPFSKPGEEESIPDYRYENLSTALGLIGYTFDEYDQNSVKVYFNHIQSIVDIEHEGVLQLGLGLDPSRKSTHMLIEQSKECLRRLWSIKNGKRTAYPYSSPQLAVPFIEIPIRTDEHKIETFGKEINRILPLQLVMGHVVQNIST